MSGVKLLNSLMEEDIAQEGLISKIKEKLKKKKLQRELEKQNAEEEKKRLAEMEAEKRKEEEDKIIEAHKYRIKDRQKLLKLAKPILDKYEKKYSKTIFSATDSSYDELFEQGFYAYFKIGNWDAWNYDPAIKGNSKKLDEVYAILEDCVDEINKVLPKNYRCEYDGDWDTVMIYIIEMNGVFESVIMSMDEFEIPSTESIEIDNLGLEYVVATKSEIFGIDWRGNRLDIAEEGWFKNMKEKAEARRQRRKDESYSKDIDPEYKQSKEPLKLSDVIIEEIRYNTNRKALKAKYPNAYIQRPWRDEDTVVVLFLDKETGKNVADMTIDKRKDTIWLEDLKVKSEYQGRGFSKEMVKLAVTQYKVQYLETYKEGKLAHVMYLKCGFKDVSADHPYYEKVVDVMEYPPNIKENKATEGLGVLESILNDDDIAEEGIISSFKDKLKKLKEHSKKVLVEIRKNRASKYENLPDPSTEEKAYMEEVIDYTTNLIKKATSNYPDMKDYLDMDECNGKTKYQWGIVIYDFESKIEEIEYAEDSQYTSEQANAELKKLSDAANKVYSEVEKGIKKKYPDVKVWKDGDATFVMLTLECPKKENKATEGVELTMEKYGVLESILNDDYDIAEEGLISSIKEKWNKLKEKNRQLREQQKQKNDKKEERRMPTAEEEKFHKEVKKYVMSVAKKVTAKHPISKRCIEIEELDDYSWEWSMIVYGLEDVYGDSDVDQDELKSIISDSSAALEEIVQLVKAKYPDITVSKHDESFCVINVSFPVKPLPATESILDYILSDEF